jgi:hypothetical protein
MKEFFFHFLFVFVSPGSEDVEYKLHFPLILCVQHVIVLSEDKVHDAWNWKCEFRKVFAKENLLCFLRRKPLRQT